MEKSIYSEFGLLGLFFKAMDEHQAAGTIVLLILAAVTVWAMFIHNFTTSI